MKQFQLLMKECGEELTYRVLEDRYEAASGDRWLTLGIQQQTSFVPARFQITANGLVYLLDGETRERVSWQAAQTGEENNLHIRADKFDDIVRLKARGVNGTSGHGKENCSPMPGKVLKVLVKSGDHVKAGEVMVIVEAMKMEHAIKANQELTVGKVLVSVGSQVKSGQLLVEVQK